MEDDSYRISDTARQKLMNHVEAVYNYDRLNPEDKKEFIQSLLKYDLFYNGLAGKMSNDTLFLLYIYMSVEPAGGRYRGEQFRIFRSI